MLKGKEDEYTHHTLAPQAPQTGRQLDKGDMGEREAGRQAGREAHTQPHTRKVDASGSTKEHSCNHTLAGCYRDPTYTQ